ncbi:MAG TPA: hypothetical protein PK733_07365 [Clostridiales bacterium]|nr:hypothetical protein [Clostridiales bacterium]
MNNASKTLLVGWASREITPERSVALCGQLYERISKYVRDPLTITALALEEVDEKGKTCGHSIIVSCDLIAIYRTLLDAVRERLKHKTISINVNKVFIFATHTHTGPVYGKSDDTTSCSVFTINDKNSSSGENIITAAECFEFLVDKICEAIEEAWSNRTPGNISSAMERAEIGFCRMVMYRDGRSIMYGDTNTADFEGLLGSSDSAIEMLFFWNVVKELTGIVINVSCPSQVVEHMSFISADFWGETRKEIRKKLGDNIFVLPITGASGDQSPRDLVRLKRDTVLKSSLTELNTSKPITDNSTPGWEMYDERGLYIIAERISSAVNNAYTKAEKTIKSINEYKHVVEEILLPIRRVSMQDYKNALEQCNRIVRKYGIDENIDIESLYSNLHQTAIREEIFLPYGIVERYKMQQEQEFYKTEIHAVRLNDTVIVTNPFELYLEYGMRIRARCKAKQVIIAQLACDSAGYLPTERAVKGGGYSSIVASNIVGPEGGSLLVAHTVELVNNMFRMQ